MAANGGANVKRWVLVAAVVVAAAALVYWLARPGVVEVETAAVERRDMRVWVEEQAVTRVPRVYRVTMPLDGRIEPITLKEGDRVREGEVIAMLETDDLDAAVEMASARVARIEAELARTADTRLERTALDQVNEFLVSLDRTVEAAEERTRAGRARRDFAAEQLQRAREAREAGAATATEMQRAEVEAVEAEVEHQTGVLTLAATMATRAAARIAPRFINEYIAMRQYDERTLEQDLREAREQLERARRDRTRAVVTSPIDGVVFGRAVADRAALAAGELLLELGKLEALEVEAEVLSEEAALVEVGAAAEVYGGAVGEAVRASVLRVYPQGFMKVSALGIEQQRVLVVLGFEPGALEALAERGRTVGAEYRVRARILVSEHAGALVVPRTAIFRGEDGGWRVFVARDGRAGLRDLRIGEMTAREAQVLDGLAEGERVILSAPAAVEEGVRVRAIE